MHFCRLVYKNPAILIILYAYNLDKSVNLYDFFLEFAHLRMP